MKFLKSLADKYWWAAIPLSALSFLSLCLQLLETFGLDTRQWLDIVHSIVIRWNYWLDHGFQWVEAIIPFDIDITPTTQNVLVIMALLFLPVGSDGIEESLSHLKYKSEKYFTRTIMAYVHILAFILMLMLFIIVLFSDLDGADNRFNVEAVAIFLCLGMAFNYVVRRKFFYSLVFVAALLLSVEGLRFVPKIQPQVDAFQAWLESVPTAPETDNGAPTP